MFTVFTDGVTLFDDLFICIDNAKEYIFIESYIFRDDRLGQKLKRLLIKKSRENVKISIIYDQIGCLFTSKKFFCELRANGIHVTHFFDPLLYILPRNLNNRNHQKIWVIDGEISYLGGFNIGSEYLGKSKKFGNWRDTHVKLLGVHARHLAYNIYKDLITLTAAAPLWLHNLNISSDYDLSPHFLEIIRNDPLNNNSDIHSKFIDIIQNAANYVFIQTPYFIPDKKIISALKSAAKKGVDVKIMIPNKPDHPIVYWGTYYFAGELLHEGIKCFTYNKGFLHSKTIIVDDCVCSIGSSNFDMRSFNLNYEINTFIYSQYTTCMLRKIFEQDITSCNLLTLDIYQARSPYVRFKELIARLISPLL